MKIRYVLSITVLTLLAAVASAGLKQPAVVTIDFNSMTAFGDQVTARIAADDVSFIGCGVRVFDDGVNPFSFGFCQAGVIEDGEIVCFTLNPNLLNEIKAISAYAFITFSWQDDGFGGAECIRVGFSTQSFYLPKNVEGNKAKK